MAPLPPVTHGHTAPVAAVDWSPDGRHVLTADISGRTCVWDVDAYDRPPLVLQGGSRIRVARFAPVGSLIATAGDDGLHLWDPERGGGPVTSWRNGERLARLAWSPDAATVAAASTNDVAMVCTPRTGEVTVLDGRAVAWIDPSLLVALVAGEAVTRDGRRGWAVADIAPIDPRASDLAWSGDARWVAVRLEESILVGPDLHELRPIPLHPTPSYLRMGLGRPARGPLFPVAAPRSLTIVDAERATVVAEHAGLRADDAGLSPDGEQVVTCNSIDLAAPDGGRTAVVHRSSDLVATALIGGRWGASGDRLGTLGTPRIDPIDPIVMLPFELRDSSLVPVYRGPSPTYGLDLLPGLYEVRALARDGSFHREVREVAPGRAESVLGDLAPVEPPWRGSSSRLLGPTAIELFGTSPGADPVEPFTLVGVSGARTESTRSPWLFWGRSEDGAEEVPSATYAHGDRLHRCSLPVSPGWGDECGVAGIASPDGRDRLFVGVTAGREMTVIVEGLVRAGTVLEAPEILEQSLELLRGKNADPSGAALGALCLHRLGRSDGQPRWIENLATRFPWLTDGQVLLASLLAQGDRSDRERGIDLLLGAVRRRLLLTEGLSLLVQLLRRWPDDAHRRRREQALRRLTPTLRSVDWTATYLTTVESP